MSPNQHLHSDRSIGTLPRLIGIVKNKVAMVHCVFYQIVVPLHASHSCGI